MEYIGEGKQASSVSGSSCGRTRSKKDKKLTSDQKAVLANMPFFNGSESFSRFLAVFEQICKYCEYEDEAKANLLTTHLKGTAGEWLKDQDNWTTWSYDKLVVTLDEAFQGIVSSSVIRLK
jgi:hypothetical protein